MHMTMDRERFASVFGKAAAVCPSRSPKDILRHVRVVAKESGVSFAGSDMEVSVETFADAAVKTPGSVMLPAHLTVQIAREVTADTLTLRATKAGVEVIAGESRFNIPTADVQDYPTLPNADGLAGWRVPCIEFRSMIESTAFCVDPSASRYSLGGVYLEGGSGQLLATSTDGRQLVHTRLGVDGAADAEAAIVPHRGMLAAKRLMDGESCLVVLNKGYAFFVTDGTAVSSLLLEGRFPDYKAVFATHRSAGNPIRLPIAETVRSIRQAAVTLDKESRAMLVSVDATSISFAGRGGVRGESCVRQSLAEEYDGGGKFAVDPQRLLAYLEAAGNYGSEALLRMPAENSGVKVECGDYVTVIMPIVEQ